MVADECAHLFRNFVLPKVDNNNGCRGNLNNFFTNGSAKKVFASKKAVEIKSACFSILGTLQPHPAALVVHDICSLYDGLMDRFYLLASEGIKPKRRRLDGSDPVVPDDSAMKRADVQEWAYRSLKALRDYHKGDEPVKYKFDDEAYALFIDILDEYNDGKDRAKKSGRTRRLANKSDAADDFEDDRATGFKSKRILYLARFSALIHIFRSSMLGATASVVGKMTIPTIIPKSALEVESVKTPI